MHPLSAGGIEPPTKFSKRGGAWQEGVGGVLELLEGVAGKEGVTNLMTKKVFYKQNYFSLS